MAGHPLEEVAVTADRVAAEQRAIADTARAMQRQRDRGWSWSRILDHQPSPGLLDMLRNSRRHLASITTAVTAGLASALSAEGATRRQIAARLGVTHQRVSTLLRRGPAPDPGE